MLCSKCNKKILVEEKLLVRAKIIGGGVICRECIRIIQNPWYREWQIWLIIVETIALAGLLIWALFIRGRSGDNAGGSGARSGLDRERSRDDEGESINDEEEIDFPHSFPEPKTPYPDILPQPGETSTFYDSYDDSPQYHSPPSFSAPPEPSYSPDYRPEHKPTTSFSSFEERPTSSKKVPVADPTPNLHDVWEKERLSRSDEKTD